MTIQGLINKIFKANQTPSNTVSWSGVNGLKTIQEDIVDTIRQRTFFTVPTTTDLLNQGFNNAVLCYVQDNAFYRWEPNGIPNGTTIFPANDGGVWVQETIGDTDGTVTSIGITAPAAFTVTNSPVTTSGVINIAAAGTSTQYIKGDGTLGTLPTSLISGSGTTNYVSKWSNATTLTDGIIYDNGTSVGIGTNTPATYLPSTQGVIVYSPGNPSMGLSTSVANTWYNYLVTNQNRLYHSTYGVIMTFVSNGNMLLGTTVDSGYKLDINGTCRIVNTTTLSSLAGTGTRMVVADATGVLSTQSVPTGTITGSGTTNYMPKWTSSSALGNSLVYDDGTNIGIGTTTPSYKLDVNGTGRYQNDLTILGNIYHNSDILNISGNTGGITISGGSAYNSGANIRLYPSTNGATPNQTQFFASSTQTGVIFSNGNWGIGTTTDAGYKLYVNGSGTFVGELRLTGNLAAGPNRNYIIGNNPDFEVTTNTVIKFRNWYNTGDVYFSLDYANGGRATIGGVSATGYRLATSGSVTPSSAVARGAYFNNTLVASANNDVLIGLDVNPTFTNGAFTGVTNLAARINGALSINGILYGVTQYTSTGTAAGSHYLEFLSTSSTNSYLNLRRLGGANGTYAYYLNNGVASLSVDNGSGETKLNAGAGGYYLTFFSNGVEAMRIPTSRNVLIGTTTDAGFKLDVNGTIRATGNITGQNLISIADVSVGNKIYNNNFYVESTGATNIGAGQSTAVASAILQANSTTRGFLKPRMTTTQRNAIATPATGLEVYNTTTNTEDYYNGTSWVSLQTSAAAVKSYGAWQDNATQTAAASNTGYGVRFNVPNITGYGVTVQADSLGNNTLIKMANAGTYNIQFSFQFENADSAEEYIYIWLRKNGETSAADIPASNTIITIHKKQGGIPGYNAAAWNFFVDAAAADYYQIVWATTDATNVTMPFYAATAFGPSTPSAILTVNQVN